LFSWFFGFYGERVGGCRAEGMEQRAEGKEQRAMRKEENISKILK